jgi:hypothetical protein
MANRMGAIEQMTQQNNGNFNILNEVIERKVSQAMNCVNSRIEEFNSQILGRMGQDSDSLMKELRERFSQIEQLQKFSNKIADQ